MKVRERDLEHLNKDIDALQEEVDELRSRHDKLKRQHDEIEKEIDDHEAHNKIVFEQNVKLTKEIDDLEEIENQARRDLERRPVHHHIPSYHNDCQVKRTTTYSSPVRETSYTYHTTTYHDSHHHHHHHSPCHDHHCCP